MKLTQSKSHRSCSPMNSDSRSITPWHTIGHTVTVTWGRRVQLVGLSEWRSAVAVAAEFIGMEEEDGRHGEGAAAVDQL